MSTGSAQPLYDVVWPLGARAAEPAPLADRLPDLGGRSIAFVWDHVFRGDDMFARFTDVAKDRFPDASFIGHHDFGNIHGTSTEEHDAVDGLARRLREHGVDAAVVGVGA